jgi:hypothetical protein
MRERFLGLALFLALLGSAARMASGADSLTLKRDGHWLFIQGPQIPGGEIEINYLEAYCRGGSTEADWVSHTMVAYTNEFVSMSDDRRVLMLRDIIYDGVVVEHTITAGPDEVDFRLVARNPGNKRSEAVWAQPCLRVGNFAGAGVKDTPDAYAYIPKCFIFLDGKLTRLPTTPWATKARYTPGQVYRPRGIPSGDVNPRPVSPLTPSNGLIGCFSADEKWILATAWDPYEELFQGVARCAHSDFRLGGLAPGERKLIHGKIYLVPSDPVALARRYERDFPAQTGASLK